MKYQSRKFFTFILITFFALGINTTNALDLKKKIPKIGGNSSKGAGDLKDSKLRFTKIFYESSINILEAHYHLFNALEMNDEAAKTKKSIEFAKNTKKKEGKRLTNSFNAVSENSDAIEKALTKEAATSAEAKVHYAKALPFTVKGMLGAVQLPKEAKSLLDSIKADKMQMLKMKDFVKVLPKIPGFVKDLTTVSKLVVGGAKSRDVKGASDANKALGDL
jgi:hypothetical protein|tara:strand:- start:2687 stop:3346 length:660 start_codon:yes stop_codon:yes gene_type:complete